MKREDEIKILIPQLETQYGNAHDVFVKKHEKIQARVKEVVGKVIRMYPKDFELWFSEGRTQLRFEVNGEKSGELTIDHPTTYSTMENKPFRLGWYSTNVCDVNNPQHFVYLTALGKVAEDFNSDEQKIQPILEEAIKEFGEAIKEQREIGGNLERLKRELQELERVAKFEGVFSEGGITAEFRVYNKIRKNHTVWCKGLTIDNATDKTVTITFDTHHNGNVTKRLKRREAESLFVRLVDELAKEETA